MNRTESSSITSTSSSCLISLIVTGHFKLSRTPARAPPGSLHSPDNPHLSHRVGPLQPFHAGDQVALRRFHQQMICYGIIWHRKSGPFGVVRFLPHCRDGIPLRQGYAGTGPPTPGLRGDRSTFAGATRGQRGPLCSESSRTHDPCAALGPPLQGWDVCFGVVTWGCAHGTPPQAVTLWAFSPLADSRAGPRFSR